LLADSGQLPALPAHQPLEVTYGGAMFAVKAWQMGVCLLIVVAVVLLVRAARKR
jgi:hypothetical protein